MMEWQAFWLTIQLACCSTACLLLLGLPLAYWLARSRHPAKGLVEAIATLPLVLPPTVLGFYLLILLGPKSIPGSWLLQVTGTQIPFSFAGILVGSILFNLPFMVRPLVASFAAVDRQLIESAWCLGASRWRAFLYVTLPISKRGIETGCILTFAHSLGEFGVVLMLGGNRPGITRTLSISIYDQVQAMEYSAAHQTSLVLLAGSLALLLLLQSLGRIRWNNLFPN